MIEIHRFFEHLAIWLPWSIELTMLVVLTRVMLKQRRVYAFYAVYIVIVAFNGLAIPFVEYSMPRWGLQTSLDSQLRATAALSIFTCVAIACLLLSPVYRKSYPPRLFIGTVNEGWLILIGAALVIAFAARFLLLNNGLGYVGVIASSVGDFDEYYAARTVLSEQLLSETGKGFATFQLTAMLLAPVLVAYGAYRLTLGRALSLKSAAFVAGTLVLLAHGFIAAQKATLIIGFLYPVLCILLLSGDPLRGHSIRSVRRLVLAAIAAIGMMTIILIWTIGLRPDHALIGLLDRLALATVETADLYYQAFPEQFRFRGANGIWYMVNDYQQGSEQEITFEDVAEFGTGVRFSANANFIAISYSGLGYLGVLLVSIVVCILTSWLDWMIRDFDLRARLLVLLPGTIGLLALTNTPFVSAFFYYGMCVSIILAAALRLFGRFLPSHKFATVVPPRATSMRLSGQRS